MDELSWHILYGDDHRPYSYPSMSQEERRVAMLLDALQGMQPYEGGCSGWHMPISAETKNKEPPKNVLSKIAHAVDDRTRSLMRKIRNTIDRRQRPDAKEPRTKC